MNTHLSEECISRPYEDNTGLKVHEHSVETVLSLPLGGKPAVLPDEEFKPLRSA